MKNKIKSINRLLSNFGFDGTRFIKAIQKPQFFWFARDYRQLKKQKGKDKTFSFGILSPVLTDKNDEGGTMKGHYFHQDLYVARKVFEKKPKKHLDVGSRTDGFVAHVASFRIIELIDIREIKSNVKNIVFRQADLMKLPLDLVESYDSVSSLHAIEHFGLGRYGDPIDYLGHIKAIENIHKLLIKGGTFYFSAPIGPQRIEFNAHRVFAVKYLLDILGEKFYIEQFSYVNDKGDFFENIQLNEELVLSNCNCIYGCGIFLLIKK